MHSPELYLGLWGWLGLLPENSGNNDSRLATGQKCGFTAKYSAPMTNPLDLEPAKAWLLPWPLTRITKEADIGRPD
jgi:hypothetical protein